MALFIYLLVGFVGGVVVGLVVVVWVFGLPHPHPFVTVFILVGFLFGVIYQ